MSTLLISPPACPNHENGMGHPERPDRLRAIEQALEDERFHMLARAQAPLAPLEIVALCHPMDYIVAIREAAPSEGEGMVRLDYSPSRSVSLAWVLRISLLSSCIFLIRVMNRKAGN